MYHKPGVATEYLSGSELELSKGLSDTTNDKIRRCSLGKKRFFGLILLRLIGKVQQVLCPPSKHGLLDTAINTPG